jgi:hypothetical protein
VGNKDCHCLDADRDQNDKKDASCGIFDETCVYNEKTLNFENEKEREMYCSFHSGHEWCQKKPNSVGTMVWAWERKCDDKTSNDDILECCMQLDADNFIREWKQYGVQAYFDMTTVTCKTADYCSLGLVDDTIDDEEDHAEHCGYSSCYIYSDHHQLKECCTKAKADFGDIFKKGTKCEQALNYAACDTTKPSELQNSESLACSKTTTECSKSTKCFPECCRDKEFDFSTAASIKASEESDCFKEASYLITPLNDKDNLIGKYIYKYSPSCKHNGIINPKCCNKNVAYKKDDPCYCYGSYSYNCNNGQQVDYTKCVPGASQYPACCFDIGNKLFGDNNLKHKEFISDIEAARWIL